MVRDAVLFLFAVLPVSSLYPSDFRWRARSRQADIIILALSFFVYLNVRKVNFVSQSRSVFRGMLYVGWSFLLWFFRSCFYEV